MTDVVHAARRRADPAQLRMDARAVHALLVVLDDELPVGRQLVGVRGRDHESFRFVIGDVGLDPVERLGHRGRSRRPRRPSPSRATPRPARRPGRARRSRSRRRGGTVASPPAHRRGRSANRGTDSGWRCSWPSLRTRRARGRGGGRRCRSRAARRRHLVRAARNRHRRRRPAVRPARRDRSPVRRRPMRRRTGGSAPTPARRRRGRRRPAAWSRCRVRGPGRGRRRRPVRERPIAEDVRTSAQPRDQLLDDSEVGPRVEERQPTDRPAPPRRRGDEGQAVVESTS